MKHHSMSSSKTVKLTGVDLQFGIESDYNFDSDDDIRLKYVDKIESNYSVDSLKLY